MFFGENWLKNEVQQLLNSNSTWRMLCVSRQHVLMILWKFNFYFWIRKHYYFKKSKFYHCDILAALNFDDSMYLNKSGNDLYKSSAYTLKVKRRQYYQELKTISHCIKLSIMTSFPGYAVRPSKRHPSRQRLDQSDQCTGHVVSRSRFNVDI